MKVKLQKMHLLINTIAKGYNMYGEKKPNYFSNVRSDVFSYLPEKVDRVLEIGCGTGETLSFIKSKYKNSTAVGIELTESAAELASKKIDLVKNIDVENYNLLTELGKFDLILLLDVLEHLKDPWIILKSLAENNLTSGGTVITSIPNARNHTLLIQLLLGNFEYTESGILDRTHLRFFTRKSMLKMIKEAGLNILECKPTNINGNSRSSLLNKLSFGFFSDFLAVQYIIKSIKK